MKRAQIKDILRNILKQKVSFLSIILIAMLGVTAFLGIDYSAAALKKNGSAMYREANYRDVEIISTVLLSEADLEAILAVEGVADAEPVWQTGARVTAGDIRYDAEVLSLPARINLPSLREGHLPEQVSQCAVEQELAGQMGWSVGDTIELTDSSGETAQYLNRGSFEITGLVAVPDHPSNAIPNKLYILVLQEAFDKEALDGCFMKAEVVMEKDPAADRFSAAYLEEADRLKQQIETLAETRTPVRDAEVRQQYAERIDESEAELQEGRDELQKAREELDDGWKQLEDGEQESADGKAELAEAETTLENSWQELLDAKKELEEAEAELADAKAELDRGESELQKSKTRLDNARAQLAYSYNKLEDSKSEVRMGVRAAIAESCGEEAAASIRWASRKKPKVDSSSTKAYEFWLTESFQFDMDKSLGENVSAFVYSGEITDEMLIRGYASYQDGGEE